MSDNQSIADPGRSEAHSADVVDLADLGAQLLEQARAHGHGRTVRAALRQPGQRVLLLALVAGGGLPEHDAPGPASLHCLTGRVSLTTSDRAWQLSPGCIVRIPDTTHAVLAREDSTCLLVLSLPDD